MDEKKHTIEGFLRQGDITMLAQHFDTNRPRVYRALRSDKDLPGYHEIKSYAVNMIHIRLHEIQVALPILKAQLTQEI